MDVLGEYKWEYGRHRGLFWEKDWESINEGSYSGIIIPIVDEILGQYPDLSFQQDNAPGHASAFTKSVIAAAGFRVIIKLESHQGSDEGTVEEA
jgi:hypothetical protein